MFERSLELRPDNAATYLVLSTCYSELGMKAEAMAALDRYDELSPEE